MFANSWMHGHLHERKSWNIERESRRHTEILENSAFQKPCYQLFYHFFLTMFYMKEMILTPSSGLIAETPKNER